MFFRLGDYDTHHAKAEFADLLYANSYIPLINRPTRVTRFSATLIDNILQIISKIFTTLIKAS